MALDRETAKKFVINEYKNLIKQKTGNEPSEDAWGIEVIAESIASLVDYLIANNEVNVMTPVNSVPTPGKGKML